MKVTSTLGASLLVLSLVAAACGSDDAASSSGGDTATSGSAQVSTPADTAAADTTAAAADTTVAADTPAAAGLAAAIAATSDLATPPSKIGPTIPLTSAPPAKTVAWLECSLPSCQVIGKGFKAAAAAIGWKLEVISFTDSAAAAAQQAVDLGVDYIAITGTAPALIQDQIDAADAKGIGFYSCYDTSDPAAEGGVFRMQCGDEAGVALAGENLSNLVIADSAGAANVLMVNIPDFAVLKIEADSSDATYKANCPDCTFTELKLTLEQLLAGEIPGAVVASIQSDPSINYVHFSFDGIAGGVVSVLQDADLLEGRTLVGVDFSAAILQDIVDGNQKFWSANPKEYSGWLMIDAMARQSLGMDNPEERTNAVLPSFFVQSPEQAEPLIATDGWPGPEGMEEQFKTLWGV